MEKTLGPRALRAPDLPVSILVFGVLTLDDRERDSQLKGVSMSIRTLTPSVLFQFRSLSGYVGGDVDDDGAIDPDCDDCRYYSRGVPKHSRGVSRDYCFVRACRRMPNCRY